MYKWLLCWDISFVESKSTHLLLLSHQYYLLLHNIHPKLHSVPWVVQLTANWVKHACTFHLPCLNRKIILLSFIDAKWLSIMSWNFSLALRSFQQSDILAKLTSLSCPYMFLKYIFNPLRTGKWVPWRCAGSWYRQHKLQQLVDKSHMRISEFFFICSLCIFMSRLLAKSRALSILTHPKGFNFTAV